MSTSDGPTNPHKDHTADGGLRVFTALTGLTTLSILTQAVLAGEFVSQGGKAGWISAHSYVAVVVMVFALGTAVAGWSSGLRREAPQLWQAAAALFVLTAIQTGIGHAITDGGTDGLIVVHVPLALVIFGITVWLSVQSAALRRSRAQPTTR